LTDSYDEDGREKCACGKPATAGSSRGECGGCFRRRLRSVAVDTSTFDTAEHDKTYYDRDSIRSAFGEDARERMLEETDGLGYARSTSDGDVWHRNRNTHEVEKLTDRQIDDAYLGARTEHELDV
jgi:hypothetical protein